MLAVQSQLSRNHLLLADNSLQTPINKESPEQTMPYDHDWYGPW